jgi:uncharacterized membrane protein
MDYNSQMKTNSAATINIILIIIVVTFALGIPPAHAQTIAPQSIVRAVLFWMEGCPHCHYVLNDVLPPIQEKYGDQLEIKLIELIGSEEVLALYQLAETWGIPKSRVVTPFLVIGEHTLIGSEEIPAELPGLIDSYLASGGVGWPEIPGLDIGAESAAETPSGAQPPLGGQAIDGAVEGVLFTTPDCADCQVLIAQAIAPLQARYGDRFQISTVEIVTSKDVAYLYHVAAGYDYPLEQVDLPLVIIGDTVLVGEQIVASLESTVSAYLARGGVESPKLPARSSLPNPTAESEEVSTTQYNGFILAIIILVVMLAGVIFSLIVLVRSFQGSAGRLTRWSGRFEALIPLLAVIGLGIATYLAYVETQAVQAACGPIGDCNTVQSSPYARLFGALPIGVLGVAGYLLILGAWFIQRNGDRVVSAWAGLGLYAMAFGGTLFSLYLTYLEPFVIRAVCAWCLSSAVIVTAILLLSQAAGIRAIDKLSGIQNGA